MGFAVSPLKNKRHERNGSALGLLRGLEDEGNLLPGVAECVRAHSAGIQRQHTHAGEGGLDSLVIILGFEFDCNG